MSDYKFACPACGQHLSGDIRIAGAEITCPNCQFVFHAPPATQPEASSAAASHAKMVPEHTSRLAVASLICSCATLLTGPFGAVAGIICGHMAKSRIRQNPALRGRGLATAGLILGYSLLAVGIIAIGVLLALVGQASKVVQQTLLSQTNGIVRIEQSKRVESPPATDAKPDGSGWTLELDAVKIPSEKVHGRIHGKDFRPEKIEGKAGFLSFRQGDGFFPDLEFSVVLFENDFSKLAGRVFRVPGDERMKPHVWMKWKDAGQNPPKQETFTDNYALRLEFFQISNGKLPGKLYLCVPDAEKSFIRGTFEVSLK